MSRRRKRPTGIPKEDWQRHLEASRWAKAQGGTGENFANLKEQYFLSHYPQK